MTASVRPHDAITVWKLTVAPAFADSLELTMLLGRDFNLTMYGSPWALTKTLAAEDARALGIALLDATGGMPAPEPQPEKDLDHG